MLLPDIYSDILTYDIVKVCTPTGIDLPQSRMCPDISSDISFCCLTLADKFGGKSFSIQCMMYLVAGTHIDILSGIYVVAYCLRYCLAYQMVT